MRVFWGLIRVAVVAVLLAASASIAQAQENSDENDTDQSPEHAHRPPLAHGADDTIAAAAFPSRRLAHRGGSPGSISTFSPVARRA